MPGGNVPNPFLTSAVILAPTALTSPDFNAVTRLVAPSTPFSWSIAAIIVICSATLAPLLL